jgi:Family of unknown function (DUF6152)
MTIKSVVAVAAVFLASLPAPTLAHHSFGHYDMAKLAEIEGTVRKYEWSNPHCWLFVDVKSADGKAVTYGFELSSVGEMLRRGWKKSTVAFGDKVKVKYRPMVDGTAAGLLVSAERNGAGLGDGGTLR